MTMWKTTEVAEYLGVSAATVVRMTLRDGLTHIKTMGGHRRYRKEDIDEYVKRKQAEAAIDCNRQADNS